MIPFGRLAGTIKPGPLSQGEADRLNQALQALDDLIGSLATFASPPLTSLRTGNRFHLRLDLSLPFDAEITGGTNPYSWREIYPTATGAWAVLTGGRTGTSNAYETGGRTDVTSGTWVRMRQGHTAPGVQDFNFTLPVAGGGGGGSLTVQDVDGSPSIPNVTVLQVDQADGYVLTSPGAGAARLDFTFPSTILQPIIFQDSITIQGGGIFIDGPVTLTPFDWRPGPGPILSNTALPTASKLKLFAEGDLELTGFAGGTNGRFLWIENRKDSPGTLILKNEDARSDPPNQIVTPSGGPAVGPVDFKIPPRCTVGLEYNGIDQKWYVVHVPDRAGSGIGPGPAPVAFNLTVSETQDPGESFDQISTIFVDSDDGFFLEQNQANAVRIRFTPPAIPPFDLTVGSDGTELSDITRIVFAEEDSLRIEDAGPGEVLVRADDFLPAGPTAKHGLVPAPPTTVPIKAQFLRHDARFAELRAGDLPNGGGGGGTGVYPVRRVTTAALESLYVAGQMDPVQIAASGLIYSEGLLIGPAFMTGLDRTLNRISVYVETNEAGIAIRFGIYEAISAENTYPGPLAWESSAATAAAAGWLDVALSFPLRAGVVYWIMLKREEMPAGSGVLYLSSLVPTWAPLGQIYNAGWGTYVPGHTVYAQLLPAGPLPSPFPAPNPPFVGIQVATDKGPLFLLRF